MAAIIVNLECMTNMHVGNGDVNYNIIDNEVEKDPVTGYPTINASGVKGALREFFNGDSELRQYVSTLFGADKAGDTTPGQLKVLCADMIARAARASSGKQAYYLITTQTALDKYCNNCEIFLGKPVVYEKKSADESEAAEGFRLEEKVELNGKTLYILPEETCAFGDNLNDIAMLQKAGMSYAVANARGEVKAAAKKVCPSYSEDGVLQTLIQIFHKNRKQG